MILLMEKLNKSQKYKLETFYLSVSIADNYLSKLATLGQKAPCLKKLAISCFILAAKIGEKDVSVQFLLNELTKHDGIRIKCKDLVEFESKVLNQLEFKLRYPSSIDFLPRYQRLLGLDLECTDVIKAEKIEE